MNDPILASVLEIEGANPPEVISYLFELAQGVRDGCIVEIGSWRGRSTAALGLGSQKAHKVPVYAIEPHEKFEGIGGGKFGSADRVKFFENMLRIGVLDVVRLVNLSSEYVTHTWPSPVGLLWIDGDHRYRSVRADVLSWLPHLRPDATVVFDDATNSRIGPFHVVEELVRGGNWSRGPEVGKTKTLIRISSESLDTGRRNK
jgi:predicted O-methyltransferase YrrM